MRFQFALLPLSLALVTPGTPVPPTERPCPIQVGDPVDSITLTPALLQGYIDVKAKLPDFWRTHSELHKTARASGIGPTVPVMDTTGTIQQKHVGVFDYVRLVKEDTTLAALFADAHFSPDRFLPVQVAVYQALCAVEAEEATHHAFTADTVSVSLHDMALVRSHEEQLRLAGAGVGVPGRVGHEAPALGQVRMLDVGHGADAPKFGDGHVYVLDFTAHWCIPCMNYYPVMAEVAKKYGDRGVRIVYVTQLFGYYGTEQDIPAATELDSLTHYAKKHEYAGPVAVMDNVMTAGFQAPSGFSFPQIVIVDGTGHVRFNHKGWDKTIPSEIFSTLDTALASPGGK